jgi:formiminotetrahydrofolate cyclodeaminase
MVLAALDVPPAVSHQKALQASLASTLRASVDEVALQASLIRTAHAQLNLDLASGNARAAKATQAKLDGYQVAFMKAQQNVRANLLQLQGHQAKAQTRVD